MHGVNEVLRKSTKREKGMYMFTLFQNYNEDPGILHICFCHRAVVPMFSIILMTFNDGNWTGLFRAMGIFGGKTSSAQTN